VRVGALVIGPAGSGKSTFCEMLRAHAETMRRRVHVVNLDPAADHFSYPVAIDIRDLISLEDAMSEMRLGPNGGLIFCMEYLVENIQWLQDELDEIGADEYILFDCPGQIELYSHVPAMQTVVRELQRCDFRMAATYLLDSQFVADASKFISGVLCCLSAMTSLELPHVNVLSKCDQLPSRGLLEEFLDADAEALRERLDHTTRPELYRLNAAICELIDDWSMVQFLPSDPRDSDTIDQILAQMDHATQYHEDVEPRIAEDDDCGKDEADSGVDGMEGGDD